MKPSQPKFALLLAILALSSSLSGCVLVDRIRARNAINEGVKAFRAGQFAEAEENFRLAEKLDPSQKNTTYFIARSVHEQYKPGVSEDANVAKAEEAIKAYEAVLNSPEADPRLKDKAYEAIVYFFNMLGRKEEGDKWLTDRATNESVPPEKRSEAFTVLASKQATCSNNVTDANKKEEKGQYIWYMPENQEEFNQAVRCADEGLRLAEEAIRLNPSNAEAMRVKRNLLYEKAYQAQMQKNVAEFDRFKAEADKANAEYERLDTEMRERRKAEEAAKEKEEK